MLTTRDSITLNAQNFSIARVIFSRDRAMFNTAFVSRTLFSSLSS